MKFGIDGSFSCSVIIFLGLFVNFVSPLICETCDGSTCFDQDRWVQESCLPSTQFCYRLSNNGQAFRRGCADFPCAKLPGVEPGMECRTCSHDRCNNERDNFFHQRGGGVSWKTNNSVTSSFLLSLSFLMFVLLW